MYGNCPRWLGSTGGGAGHPLYNYSFCAARSARKYGRVVARGGRSDEGLQAGAKGSEKENPTPVTGRGGGRGRPGVDNSQDRIVPGAKNQSIPACYRMVETLVEQVPSHAHPLLLKMPLRDGDGFIPRGDSEIRPATPVTIKRAYRRGLFGFCFDGARVVLRCRLTPTVES